MANRSSVRAKITLSRDAKQIYAAGARGLRMAGEFVLEAANRIVPHDTGMLQDSGAVDMDEQNLQGTVYYDTPYAARLHEHPEYNFQHGRKGKWLENTNKEKGPETIEIVADQLRKETAG